MHEGFIFQPSVHERKGGIRCAPVLPSVTVAQTLRMTELAPTACAHGASGSGGAAPARRAGSSRSCIARPASHACTQQHQQGVRQHHLGTVDVRAPAAT